MAEVSLYAGRASRSLGADTLRFRRIPAAFTAEQAEGVIKNVWTRLGMSPTDKTTWNQERINMPNHVLFDAAEFAPRAWYRLPTARRSAKARN
jgi:hypothetical protein